MLKMGMPDGAVQQKMATDGVAQHIVNSVLAGEVPAPAGQASAISQQGVPAGMMLVPSDQVLKPGTKIVPADQSGGEHDVQKKAMRSRQAW
jgi:hypothetical protein